MRTVRFLTLSLAFALAEVLGLHLAALVGGLAVAWALETGKPAA